MKKAAKIVLLVVLLAMVGGIVYTVLTWPIYPQPKKNVDSYAQLREDLAQTELLAPPEDILPWHDVTYGEELDGRGRTSKARGFLISGHVSRGDASCFVELVGLEDTPLFPGKYRCWKITGRYPFAGPRESRRCCTYSISGAMNTPRGCISQRMRPRT